MTANQIAYQNLQEQMRANRTKEQETNRSNLATEGLRLKELQETNRHNVVGEGETNRHNVVTENEVGRHNLATERETTRSNQAKEFEANRHNVATENLGVGNLQLGYSNLAEAARSNKANEGIRETANTYSVLNAEKAAQASKYAADTRARSQNLSTAIQAAGKLYSERQQNLRSLMELPAKIFNNLSSGVKSLGDTFNTLRR